VAAPSLLSTSRRKMISITAKIAHRRDSHAGTSERPGSAPQGECVASHRHHPHQSMLDAARERPRASATDGPVLTETKTHPFSTNGSPSHVANPPPPRPSPSPSDLPSSVVASAPCLTREHRAPNIQVSHSFGNGQVSTSTIPR